MGRNCRRVPWGYRNTHPEEFPHKCGQCRKKRRFKRQNDLANHERAIHGMGNNKPSVGDLIGRAYSMRISTTKPRSVPGIRHGYASSSYTNNAFTGAHGYSYQGQGSGTSSFLNRTQMDSSIKPDMFSWTRQTLTSNLQTKIEPTEEYISMCNRSVDLLVQHLYQIDNPTFTPREVLKGGSLGKGTAVKDKSDIDLIVYMRDGEIDGTIEKQRERAIAFLKSHILSHSQCSFDGQTQAAVKVKLQVDTTHTVEVDILPTFIYHDNPTQIYDKMKDDRRFRTTASAALSPLQRDFVKPRPAKVKQLIRLVKYWKGTCLQKDPSKRLPTSYPLELITIGEWEDAGKPEDFDMRKGFYHVMNAIKNYKNIHRVWYLHYDKSRIARAGVLNEHYVIDPANPYNNVMDRCDAWDDVSRQVGTFLQQELFSGISPSGGWQ